LSSLRKNRSFLRRDINQNVLLADATIFAVEDGPLNLILPSTGGASETPAIREDDIARTSGR
jgi:hypothetical protein